MPQNRAPDASPVENCIRIDESDHLHTMRSHHRKRFRTIGDSRLRVLRCEDDHGSGRTDRSTETAHG